MKDSNNNYVPSSHYRGTSDARRSANSYLNQRQIERLRVVLDDYFEVHGRGNFPMLTVQLRTLIVAVRQSLRDADIDLRSIRLNGGAASHVVANEQFPYSDLDLIFNVDLPTAEHFDKVRDAVLDSLLSLLPDSTNRDKIDRSTLKDVYIRKMVKVCPVSPPTTVSNNDQHQHNNSSTTTTRPTTTTTTTTPTTTTTISGPDRWSLFALNNDYGKCIELKFVDRMRRQFEFSVDSFQLALEPLLDEDPPPSSTATSTYGGADTEDNDDVATTWSSTDSAVGSETSSSQTHSTLVRVQAESMFGNYAVAMRHLNKRLIDTKRPEEIRGGGLLKYCHLLTRGYRPAHPSHCRTLERYMCTRFFIDFSAVNAQEAKLLNYIKNHLVDEDYSVQHEFLALLHKIISVSTVCLMKHEHRQTLEMINRLIYELSTRKYYNQQCVGGNYCTHAPRQTLLYLPRNASYWVPVV